MALKFGIKKTIKLLLIGKSGHAQGFQEQRNLLLVAKLVNSLEKTKQLKRLWSVLKRFNEKSKSPKKNVKRRKSA